MIWLARKKGIRGILYLTKAPKFAVASPTEKAKIVQKRNEKNSTGVFIINLKLFIRPNRTNDNSTRKSKIEFSIGRNNSEGTAYFPDKWSE